MITVKLYLHDYIVDTLTYFGTIQECVNKMLDEAMEGSIDLEALPICPDRSGAKQYSVMIDNPEYEEMREFGGKCNQRYSIRRLVYHFVDNELYEQFGWQIKKSCKSKIEERLDMDIARLYSDLTTVNKRLSTYERSRFSKVMKSVYDCLEEIRDDRKRTIKNNKKH